VLPLPLPLLLLPDDTKLFPFPFMAFSAGDEVTYEPPPEVVVSSS
jgi:hypothetical protein